MDIAPAAAHHQWQPDPAVGEHGGWTRGLGRALRLPQGSRPGPGLRDLGGGSGMDQGLIIRPATADDAGALAAIYGDAVLHGLGTFEEIPPDAEEMARRLAAVRDKGMPYVVAELDGQVAGQGAGPGLHPAGAGHRRVRAAGPAPADGGGRRVGEPGLHRPAPGLRLRGPGRDDQRRLQVRPLDRYRHDAAIAERRRGLPAGQTRTSAGRGVVSTVRASTRALRALLSMTNTIARHPEQPTQWACRRTHGAPGGGLEGEVAGELGLEPRMTVPKTAVLPLHHSPAGTARL